MKKTGYVMLFLLLVGGALALAQETNPNQQEQQLTAEQQALQEERALFQEMQAKMQSGDQQGYVTLAEQFIEKYPNSQNLVYVRYFTLLAYQSLNNPKKMLEHGLEAEKMIPNNPVITAALAYAYAAEKQDVEAETYANRAITEINALVKPEQMPQEQFDGQINQLKCAIHSTLGDVHLMRAVQSDEDEKKHDEELVKSVSEFETALKSNPRDDISYYRMGVALGLQEKIDESLTSLAKAVVLNGSVSDQAKNEMELIIKNLTEANALEDRSIEKFLEKATADLGIQLFFSGGPAGGGTSCFPNTIRPIEP
jgi:tetratricopeptide (TPR) repeat protein